MKIHKDVIDLMGYARTYNDLTIIPVRIDADDVSCEVEFETVNKMQLTRTIVRRGKHKNFNFTTSINNIPLTINLSTGIMRKVREHND